MTKENKSPVFPIKLKQRFVALVVPEELYPEYDKETGTLNRDRESLVFVERKPWLEIMNNKLKEISEKPFEVAGIGSGIELERLKIKADIKDDFYLKALEENKLCIGDMVLLPGAARLELVETDQDDKKKRLLWIMVRDIDIMGVMDSNGGNDNV